MYDRDAAVAYARKWWNSRNPMFYDFTNQGGDCTNFISQCLYAGVGEMNFTPVMGWYYRNQGDRTASWSGVQYLYNFLVSNKGRGPSAALCDITELVPGDIVQLRFKSNNWNHSLLVTQISDIAAVAPVGATIEGAAANEPHSGHVLVATHTNDSVDRPLNSYIYAQARYLKIT